MTFVRLPDGTPRELVALRSALVERLRPAPGRRVELDERTHLYTVAGEAIPSVTELRRGPVDRRAHRGGAADYDFAAPWVCQRGTDVHALIAETERLRAIGYAPDVPECYAPFLAAWQAFVRTTGWVTFAVEHSLEGLLWTDCAICGATSCAHREPEAIRYAGTLDVLGAMREPPSFSGAAPWSIGVVEVKTGSSMPQSVGIQGAGYVIAVCGYVGSLAPVFGFGVRIGEDGSQIDADGLMVLGKKRTKRDEGRYPDEWETVPKLTTFRPIVGQDFDNFRSAALTWHLDRKTERGGDANAEPDDSNLHLEPAPASSGAGLLGAS